MSETQRMRAEKFVLGGVEYEKGDQIRVLPSASRHRDGFIGKVLYATVQDGVVLHVDVFGAAGHKAPATRTFPPERLTHLPKKHRGPRRSRFNPGDAA